MTLKKIPGALLAVDPVWAEAMGYDPAELEDADPPEDGADDAAQLLAQFERWRRASLSTVALMDHIYYPEPEPPEPGDVWELAPLVYRLAVLVGAQPEVAECWPSAALSRVADRFYASTPPKSV